MRQYFRPNVFVVSSRVRLGALAAAALLAATISCPRQAIAQAAQTRFSSGNHYVIVEFLDDDLVHLEFSAARPGLDGSEAIATTPMIYRVDYPGPSRLVEEKTGRLESPQLRVQVASESLCVTLVDKTRDPELLLATLCPVNLDDDRKGIQISPESFTHVYGLGQQFGKAGSADGDWVPRVRTSSSVFGNVMESFAGGMVGNTQIPVAYFLGQGSASYALFVDSLYKQKWDFSGNPWKVETEGDALRLYVMCGPALQDLRKDYLELTGRPPVPPKKAFGLWVSEYGFDSWAELDGKLATLRQNGFPIDGFVLDLQWYGGIAQGSEDSRMGSLSWDLSSFPDPGAKIAHLWEREGVGILLTEQSYVAKKLPEHEEMQSRGYLVRECETCGAAYLLTNPWWGRGGMIDWSNETAGAFWHDWKREPLLDLGIVGHWTDLGEPELYDSQSWYAGVSIAGSLLHGHADIHNVYNLKWSQSIYEGYVRNNRTERPFILSRSGTAGSQRYGVAMWSGDIGSNLQSLAAQLNVQMHMSMSGIDYFGSDIGGFYRDAVSGSVDETYTQWFAEAMAFDVPARSHTQNLCNCQETAPDRVGDLASNLANLRLRYELTPYLYSLAHRAYLYGEAAFPPLVYWFPDDTNAREMGDEKLIGRDLLVAAVARRGEKERRVYLPAGEWVNYFSSEWVSSSGEWFGPMSVYVDGAFRLPMFVRAGAVIPQMYVDEQTMNVFGQRQDGSRRDELILQVYGHAQPSSFTLYEDDGQSIGYQRGEVRTTVISQQLSSGGAQITIEGASGTYEGALAARDNWVKLVIRDYAGAESVALNGRPLVQYDTEAELETASSGWMNAGEHLVVAKSGKVPVAERKALTFVLKSVVEAAQPERPAVARVNLWKWGLIVAALVLIVALSLWAELVYRRRRGP